MNHTFNHSEDESTKLAEERTTFAFDRTRFAADRSLMAWIRTSLALIAFGFTLYKGLELLNEIYAFSHKEEPVKGTQNFAFVFVLAGTVFMALATLEYYTYLRRLYRMEGLQFVVSLTFVAAFLLSLLGLLVLADMLWGLGPFSDA